MTEMWLTSDNHFGNKGAIHHNGRPYADIDEMDDALIANWNNRVGKDDHVFHLGDVAMCPKERLRKILDRLNGKIHLVLGNHDIKRIKGDLADRFEWVKDVHMLKWGDRRLFLSHYPHYTWPKAHTGAWHCHGHCHGNLIAPATTRVDVGVDDWNYAPVHVEEIERLMADREYLVVDHHEPKKEVA